MKQVKLEELIKSSYIEAGLAYAMIQIDVDTDVSTLQMAESFWIREAEEGRLIKGTKKFADDKTPDVDSKKPKRKVDVGRIVALYTANPPRSVRWIADDLGCSEPTVLKVLKEEGVYRGRPTNKKEESQDENQSGV